MQRRTSTERIKETYHDASNPAAPDQPRDEALRHPRGLPPMHAMPREKSLFPSEQDSPQSAEHDPQG